MLTITLLARNGVQNNPSQEEKNVRRKREQLTANWLA